ncbi:MAG: hypothetical protein LC650_05040 [Actinobacteria bacterium]|nr:hypothetical protein [Actinomycetota bacterium]
MISCPGVYGVDSLACISLQTGYVPGYILLVLLVATLYFRLGREPTRERLAAVMLVTAIVTAMGSVQNMLFPDRFFIVATVLFIGSVVMLVVRS